MRIQRGISASELARQLGVVSTVISEIELGKRNPSDSIIEGIARHLDLSVDEFLSLNPSLAVRYFEPTLLQEPQLGNILVEIIRAVKNDQIAASDLQALLSTQLNNSPTCEPVRSGSSTPLTRNRKRSKRLQNVRRDALQALPT